MSDRPHFILAIDFEDGAAWQRMALEPEWSSAEIITPETAPDRLRGVQNPLVYPVGRVRQMVIALADSGAQFPRHVAHTTDGRPRLRVVD